VPALVAVGRRERNGCYGRSDHAIVDDLAAGLQAAAEECVGGAAEEHAPFSCDVDQVDRLTPGGRERFLGVHMLPGSYGGDADGRVGVRGGEVHDELDIRVRKESVRVVGARNCVLGSLRSQRVLATPSTKRCFRREGWIFPLLDHQIGFRGNLIPFQCQFSEAM